MLTRMWCRSCGRLVRPRVVLTMQGRDGLVFLAGIAVGFVVLALVEVLAYGLLRTQGISHLGWFLLPCFGGLAWWLFGSRERHCPDCGTECVARGYLDDDVRQTLAEDVLTRMEGRNVTVAVEDGVVHLSGTVDWPLLKPYVESIVRLVPGVIDVVNDVQVRAGSDRRAGTSP